MDIRQILALRPKPTTWRGEDFRIAEVKLDGYRVTIFKERDGLSAFGRKTYRDLWPKLRMNPSIRRSFESLPVNTAVDGELYVPEGTATDVSSALADDPSRLEFCAFGLPLFKEKLRLAGHPKTTLLELAMLGLDVPDRVKEPTPELVREMGVEGFVLKNDSWSQWYKMKPSLTCDVVITDWYEGKGRNAGRLGALEMSLWTEQLLMDVGRVGTGFSDDDRDELGPKECVGRVAEVEYAQVASGGRLFHPRFLRWRDDKPMEECVITQIQ